MAERLTGRQRVLVARSVHPEYRDVLKPTRRIPVSVEEIPFYGKRTVDAKSLAKLWLKEDVAAVSCKRRIFRRDRIVRAPRGGYARGWRDVCRRDCGRCFPRLVKPPTEADIVAMGRPEFGLPRATAGRLPA